MSEDQRSSMFPALPCTSPYERDTTEQRQVCPSHQLSLFTFPCRRLTSWASWALGLDIGAKPITLGQTPSGLMKWGISPYKYNMSVISRRRWLCWKKYFTAAMTCLLVIYQLILKKFVVIPSDLRALWAPRENNVSFILDPSRMLQRKLLPVRLIIWGGD